MNTANHTASIRHGLGHWLLASTAAASLALSMVSTGAFGVTCTVVVPWEAATTVKKPLLGGKLMIAAREGNETA